MKRVDVERKERKSGRLANASKRSEAKRNSKEKAKLTINCTRKRSNQASEIADLCSARSCAH